MKKQCYRCKEIKLFSEFYRDKTRKYGLSNRCKECAYHLTKVYRQRPSVRERRKICERLRTKTEKAKIYRRNYQNQKYRTSPMFRLADRISGAIRQALHKNKAHKKWQGLVGYTLDELKQHLEKQFKLGMTWDNYGEWHIDHIIPIAAFDFTNPEDVDFKKCWELKNLQPLWAKENLIKSNKVLGSSLRVSRLTG